MTLGFAGLPADDLSVAVGQVGPWAAEFDHSRVIVTGATGFVGLWLLATLAELRRTRTGCQLELVALVRDPTRARSRMGESLWCEVQPVVADVRDAFDLPPATHVVHGATPASIRSGSTDARGVLLASVVGTHHLIQSLAATGGRPRVLHLSSGAVYGQQAPDLAAIPETWTGGPVPYLRSTPYAEGKRAAEALLQDADRDGVLHAVQARLFAFMGPLLPIEEGFAIGNFAQDAAHGRNIVVHGDGSVVRSYLDAKDLAAWLIALLAVGLTDRPYNVGSPYARNLGEWAKLCADIVGVDVKLGSNHPGERSRYIPAIDNSLTLGLPVAADDPTGALRSWIDWLRLNGS